MPNLTPEMEKRLLTAADDFRGKADDFTPFRSLKKIDDADLLEIYTKLENESATYADKGSKLALYYASHSLARQSPITQTAQVNFYYNLCEVLNLPFFENDMKQPQDNPSMQFTQALWAIYSENRLSFGNEARRISALGFEPTN